jgi:hypothetical protein
MSNKKIPSTESVSTVDQDSSVLNGTATSPLKSSPLFGWLYAGSDLLSAKLDHAAGVVSQKIDDTQETINSMQAKGLEVESELRRTLNPFALVDAAQKLVASTPLFSAFSGGQKRQQKEQQLELLSAKVDLLVEQVALLAAKEAAKKALLARLQRPRIPHQNLRKQRGVHRQSRLRPLLQLLVLAKPIQPNRHLHHQVRLKKLLREQLISVLRPNRQLLRVRHKRKRLVQKQRRLRARLIQPRTTNKSTS